MKKLLTPLLLFLFLYSCTAEKSTQKTTTDKSEKENSASIPAKIDTVIPVKEKTTADYFKDLLSALEEKDFQRVDSFISPAFSDPSNGLWVYVTEGSDESIDLLGKEEKTFSKKDWKKYYLKVFQKDFMETVASLKLEEITKKKTIESRKFKQGKTSYNCWTDFDKKAKELVIHVYSETDLEDEEMNGESSTSFYFNIDSKGRPLFVKFMMAG